MGCVGTKSVIHMERPTRWRGDAEDKHLQQGTKRYRHLPGEFNLHPFSSETAGSSQAGGAWAGLAWRYRREWDVR
jgi:hypothetical protein